MRMTTKTQLEILDEALDAYGSDRTRWPAPVRLELSQLISSSPEARHMMAEAEAFDRLLDMAPNLPAECVSALSDRIMAQTARTPRVVVSKDAPVTRPKAVQSWRRHAAGISALAASLVIGVLAGQNATMAPAVSEIATAVGIESLASDSARMAATDETDVGIDGDLL